MIIYKAIFLSSSCEQNTMKQRSQEAQKAECLDEP